MLEEIEKLQLNIKTSRQLSERMLEMKKSFEKLHEELTLTRQHSQSLREEINRVAAELHLEPIPIHPDKKNPAE